MLSTQKTGQAAIEYLTTYGWMLLVVAIIGGALYGFYSGRCIESSSGFTGTETDLTSFGIQADGDIQVQVRNGAAESITIQNITAVKQNGGPTYYAESIEVIPVGSSGTVNINRPSGELKCSTFDLTIKYKLAGIKSSRIVTGSISGLQS